MKKIILTLLMLINLSSVAFAEDVDIFQECSDSLKPNVLVLFDTSISMREEDVVIVPVGAYNKATTYPGDYHATQVFRWNASHWDGTVITKDWYKYYVSDFLGFTDCNCPDDEPRCDNVNNMYQSLLDNGAAHGRIKSTVILLQKDTIACGNKEDDDMHYELVTGNRINYLNIRDAQMEQVKYNESNYKETTDYGAKIAEPRGRYDLYYYDGTRNRPFPLTKPWNPFKISNIWNRTLITKGYMDGKKALLKTQGYVDMHISPLDAGWGVAKYYMKTGNFLNYMEYTYSRRYAAIRAMRKVFDLHHNKFRFGIMQFDMDHTPVFHSENNKEYRGASIWRNQGGDIAAPCGSGLPELNRVLNGSYNFVGGKEYGEPLCFGSPALLVSDSMDITKATPLAESLVEAGLYFAGENSWYNTYEEARPYTSPIQCPNQKNYVIILSDGAPHLDFFANENDILGIKFPLNVGDEVIGENGIDNDEWVDDVASFLYDHDIYHDAISSTENGYENIVTFPIAIDTVNDASSSSYSVNHFLMQDVADGGQGLLPEQGKYYRAQKSDDILEAFENILYAVAKNSNFTAAATPTTQDDFVYSGDQTYLSYFRIESGKRGKGNITKYKFEDGKITDLNGTRVGGGLQTFDQWSDNADGDDGSNETPYEGAAYVMKKELDAVVFDVSDTTPIQKLNKVATKRNILTASASSTESIINLTTGDSPALSVKKKADADYDLTNEADKIEYIDFLQTMIYSYGSNWPLGDFVHTNVMVAEYPKGSGSSHQNDYEVDSYILAGANDGMLHAFDSSTGKEKWGFIPPSQLNRLYLLNPFNLDSPGHHWFVDGGLSLYYERKPYNDGRPAEGSEKVEYYVPFPQYAIFGERRGGQNYHILDISSKDSPVYKSAVAGEPTIAWGQSWAKPQFCQIAQGSSVTKAFLVPGGYDDNEDSLVPSDDTKGRHVALYSMESGSLGDLITLIGQAGTYSGPSISHDIEGAIVAARIIDHDHDDKRVFSRIYTGDMKGNVYLFSDDLKIGDEGLVVSKETSDTLGTWEVRHTFFKAQEMPLTVDVVSTDEATGVTTTTSVDTTYDQKIFHAPVAGYACDTGMIFFGTGDRERPLFKNSEYHDSIYGVQQQWAGDALTIENLRQYELRYTGLSLANTKIELYNSHKATNPDDIRGWYFDFPTTRGTKVTVGEKMISDPIVLDNIMIFGSYTPPVASSQPGDSGTVQCESSGCEPGDGRIYVVNTCMDAFSVKSFKLGSKNPMPQPSLVFDQETGKVLINTGSGEIIDPELPVLVPDYWKHSGSRSDL